MRIKQVRVNEVPPELDLNAVMNPRPANQALRSWSGSVNCGSDAPPPAVDRGQIHLDDKVGVTVRPGSARTRACLVSRCTLGPIGHRKRRYTRMTDQSDALAPPLRVSLSPQLRRLASRSGLASRL